MNATDASAVAAFLLGGGQIVKVPDSILVTAQEVLDFLNCSGVAAGGGAKHRPGDAKTYLCEGKRLPLGALVDLANRHRRSQQLPSFALR